MKISKKIGLSVALLTLVAIFATLAQPKKAVAGTSIDQAYAGCVENVLNVVIKGNSGDNAQQCKMDDTNGYADLNYATQEVQGIKLANYKASSNQVTASSKGVTVKVPQTIELLDQNNKPLTYLNSSQAIAYGTLTYSYTANTSSFYSDANIYEVYIPAGGDKNFSFLTMVNSDGSFQILALVNNTIHSGSPDYVYAASINKAAEGSDSTGGVTNSPGTSCTVTSGSATQNCGSTSIRAPSASSTSCEDNFNQPFAWVICPALGLADDTAGAFNGFIEDQLCFRTTPTSSSTSSTGSSVVCGGNNNLDTSVHNAWDIFKNIASSLLVIVMLVMVISQAIGGGPFDAYTVRKLLPKMVAAVIIMQFSWILLKFGIDLSNDIGRGIGNLMMAPFGGSSNLQISDLVSKSLGVHTTVTNDVFSFFVVLGAAAGLLALSVPGIAMLGLYVGLALLTAFIVLVFRKLLIIMLVILAPLAFVAWILPGTDRYFKLWQDNFIKLLFMFPLIEAFIAAGRIFAAITAGANTATIMVPPHLALAHLGPLPVPYLASSTAFAELAIIIGAYFAPYFFLPQTFKMGGMAMGAISKGVQQGMEKAGKPAKDYLNWRKGLSPWAQARAARKAEIERRSKLGFARNLGASGPLGSFRRARLGGVPAPTPAGLRREGDIRGSITRSAEEKLRQEEVKEQALELANEVDDATGLRYAEMAREDKLSYLQRHAMDPHTNEYRRQVLLAEMANLRGGGELMATRNWMFANGRGAEYNRAMQNNFDSFNSTSAMLTQGATQAAVQAAEAGDWARVAQLDMDYMAGQNDQTIATQSGSGWNLYERQALAADNRVSIDDVIYAQQHGGVLPSGATMVRGANYNNAQSTYQRIITSNQPYSGQVNPNGHNIFAGGPPVPPVPPSPGPNFHTLSPDALLQIYHSQTGPARAAAEAELRARHIIT